MDAEKYGKLIRQMRERRGIRSIDLASRIQMSQGFISKIETGSRKEVPGPNVVDIFERELGISVIDQLRALGYALDAHEPGDAITDPDLADIVDVWPNLTDDQRDLIYALIDRMMTPPAQRPSVIRERRTG